MFKNDLNPKNVTIVMFATLLPSMGIADCDTSHWSNFEWPPYEDVVAKADVSAVQEIASNYLHETFKGNSLWTNNLFLNEDTRRNIEIQYRTTLPNIFPFDPRQVNFAFVLCKVELGKDCHFFQGNHGESFFTGLEAVGITGYRILDTKLVEKLGPLDRAQVTVEFDVAAKTSGLGLTDWTIIPTHQKETLVYDWVRLTDYGFSDALTKSYWFLLSNYPIHVSIDSFRNYFDMETCRLKDMEKGTWEESEIYERLKNNLETLKKIERDTQTDKSAGH